MRKAVTLALMALAVLLTTSLAGAAVRREATSNATVVVSARTIAGLGKVLVNAKGRTLYMFVPDKQKRVTCVKSCASIWPPLKAAKGEKLTGKNGAETRLLGLDKDPSGGYVVTYDKWPLYTYLPDTKPGQATGQAVNSAGGLWYVLSTKGAVVKAKVK
jgi:predicted lipoprotein with Yx(FWY)xxD motif